MRLSALGTVGVGLTMVSVLTGATMVIAFTLGVPATAKLVRPFTLQQVATINTSVAAIEQGLVKKDWAEMAEPASKAQQALNLLVNAGPAMPSLATSRERAEVEGLRAQLKAARDAFEEVTKAIKDKDAGGLEAALKKFREAYRPVQEAAKRAVK
jgi:predicted lipid-binding transport protein (Tim44 family)